MLAKELSLRVYFIKRFNTKVVYQKCVFKRYWKGLLVKNKKNAVIYISTTNRINTYGRLKKQKQTRRAPCTSCN